MNEVLSQKEIESIMTCLADEEEIINVGRYEYILMFPTIKNLSDYFTNNFDNSEMFYIRQFTNGQFNFENVDKFNVGNLIDHLLSEKEGSPNRFLLIKQKPSDIKGKLQTGDDTWIK